MAGRHEILSFEFGLRLMQAQVLFRPGNCSLATPVGLRLALARLLAVAKAVARTNQQPGRTESLIAILKECRVLGGRRATGEIAAEAIHSCLLAANAAAIDFAGNAGLPLAWFGLGNEVANGLDRSWSQGRPQFMAGTSERPCGWLTFVDARAPSWEWENPERLVEIARQLGMRASEFVPDLPPVDISNLETIPGIDRERLWGWLCIESALRHLKAPPRPRWDRATQTLFVGATRVRRFKRVAPKQFGILDAFERSGWPDEIANPFDNATDQNTAMRDLKKGLSPKLISFHGTGSTGIRWEMH